MVEVEIKTSPERVWELVTDINLPARFSTEFLGADWIGEATGPALGATFAGRNQHRAIGEWTVPCFVDVYRPGQAFGWCTSDPDNPGARWRFELEPVAGAVRVRYRLLLGPGPSGITGAIESMPDKEPRILARRVDEHRANMTGLVEGLKAVAEAE